MIIMHLYYVFINISATIYITNYAVWSVPGHRLYMESLDLNDPTISQNSKNVAKEIKYHCCLYSFICFSNIFITLMIFIYVLIELFFPKCSDMLGLILTGLMIITGYFILKTYQAIISRTNVDDTLSTYHKRAILYILSCIHIFIYSKATTTILCACIILGKFIWIDWFLDIQEKNIKKIPALLRNKIKSDDTMKKIIKFCVSILTTCISYRIYMNYINPQIKNVILKYTAPLPLAFIPIMFYLIPTYRNIKNTEQETDDSLALYFIAQAETEEEKERILKEYLNGDYQKAFKKIKKKLQLLKNDKGKH